MKNILSRIKKWYTALPDKKRHIELISATLSIPMMLTVILLNYNNIKSLKDKTIAPATTAPIQVIVDNPANQNTATNSSEINPKTIITPPQKTECKKDIGPIQILSPQEGEIISTNNVCINISTDNNYCPVTWSYRIGTDSWSNFNNNDICLYNLTPGLKDLQIKIKSTVIDKNITLERNFTYQNSTVTPIVNSSATPSAAPSK